MIEICKYEECTGCAACANICGHSAITIAPDEYGYLHPQIAQNRCVNCGICRKVCPNNSAPEYHHPQQAFAACATDPQEQLTSSSGGIASVISRYYLRNNGIVYGCDGTDYANVHHRRIESEEDIQNLKGSKYVQSSIGRVFKLVQEDLHAGCNVTFIGTPCQIAGLLCYLPEHLKANLRTVDFVCHGVPSQQMLSDAISLLTDEHDANELNLKFRRKKWRSSILSKWQIVGNANQKPIPVDAHFISQYGLFLTGNDMNPVNAPFPKSSYIVGFLTGLLYRHSCYQCHYARPERVSDITLGDFHFRTKQPEHIAGANRALSKIIVNTSKGLHIIRSISDSINFVQLEFTELLREGGQLLQPMPVHPLREQFLKDYLLRGMKACDAALKEDKSRIERHIIITKIVNFGKTVPVISAVISILKRYVKKNHGLS